MTISVRCTGSKIRTCSGWGETNKGLWKGAILLQQLWGVIRKMNEDIGDILCILWNF